jgi:hypothetical protein
LNRFVIALTSLIVGFHGTLSAQPLRFLRGTIADSSTGESLVAANVRILGTTRGTITNASGQYVLTLEANAPHTITVSYLGYRTDTLRVEAGDRDVVRDVRLRPLPIAFPEIVVVAEDPALEIIRKAIANKRQWMDRLRSYRFDAFTRQVLHRDTAIASITEAYTTGYYRTGDTLREVVVQKRQTENIPSSENFAAVRRIVNFNDDRIELFSMHLNDRRSSYTFVGPTAPDALDHYDYTLLSTSTTPDGIELYRIRMQPKSRARPLFDGIITIADGTFAVMGVDVRPNESFSIPFLRDVNLRYRQQFALYNSIFWMPADIRINGGISVGIPGLVLPRVGIEQTSAIYDYSINVAIPDSIITRARLTTDSAAAVYDSTFWASRPVLPLTIEEARAYETLDSTQTLARQFEPKGPLAMAAGSEAAGGALDIPSIRYNRVEGLFLGADHTFRFADGRFRLRLDGGYGFASKRGEYRFEGTAYLVGLRLLGVGGGIYRFVEQTPTAGFHGTFYNTISSVLWANDYHDYFRTRGWRTFLASSPTRNLSMEVGFRSEQHRSIAASADYSVFRKSGVFRSNPEIDEGNLRSVGIDVRYGGRVDELGLILPDALSLSIEHSTPSIAKSDFDFTRYAATLTANIPTFQRDLLFPPGFRIRASAGTSTGNLPSQRMFSIDSRSSGYGPFGVLRGAGVKEFQGDAFVMLAVEHNFRTQPFLALNVPFLYRNNIELIVHGAVAQSWLDNHSTSKGWYSEAGVGLNRIVDLFRIDVTRRFTAPGGFFVTMSVATLW